MLKYNTKLVEALMVSLIVLPSLEHLSIAWSHHVSPDDEEEWDRNDDTPQSIYTVADQKHGDLVSWQWKPLGLPETHRNVLEQIVTTQVFQREVTRKN